MARRKKVSGGVRDELARTLRSLRERAGVSQTYVGEHIPVPQKRISRFELAMAIPDPDELSALAALYLDPGDPRDVDTAALLVRLADDRRRRPRPPYVAVRRGNLAEVQHYTRLLEENADTIEAIQSSCAVGLVQSPEYVRAMFEGARAEDAEAAIAERLLRQRQVVNGDQTVTIIHTEGALRSTLHSPAVMADQLDRLAELAIAATHLRVGIIPWWRPLPWPLMSGFRLYDRTTVAVSSEAGESFLDKPADLAEFGDRFDDLTGLADFGEAAASHYQRIADEYRALA